VAVPTSVVHLPLFVQRSRAAHPVHDVHRAAAPVGEGRLVPNSVILWGWLVNAR
jgi:hypothetical protein